MTNNFHLRPGMVLYCDFSTGFQPPEIIKKRPVVILSPRSQLCIVIPLSTTIPMQVKSYHHQLERSSLPSILCKKGEVWAKCDMIYTVSLARLDRVKNGHDKNGKTLYTSHFVTKNDFECIKKAVLAALGFNDLTRYIT